MALTPEAGQPKPAPRRRRPAQPAVQSLPPSDIGKGPFVAAAIVLTVLLGFQMYVFVAQPSLTNDQRATIQLARALVVGLIAAILGGAATFRAVTTGASPLKVGVSLGGTVAAFAALTILVYFYAPASALADPPAVPGGGAGGGAKKKCTVEPMPAFAGMLSSDTNSDPGWRLMDLGCPLGAAVDQKAAYEPFEFGAMFWLGNWSPLDPNQQGGTTYAVFGTGEKAIWRSGVDDFREGEVLSEVALPSPNPRQLRAPERGIGKFWRNIGGVSSGLGLALDRESAATQAQRQPFDSGWVIYLTLVPNDRLLVMLYEPPDRAQGRLRQFLSGSGR